MSHNLFDEFNPVSPTAWKQKIQVDLKGADYNKTLLWYTEEGIVVKPFYTKEDATSATINLPKQGFFVCQTIFIDEENIANKLAVDAIERGATAIRFKAKKPFNAKALLKGFPGRTPLYFDLQFLDAKFTIQLANFCDAENTFIQTDIIGHLAKTGNWYQNLKKDHLELEKIVKSANHCISIDGGLYQNAGANITQQLAYALAHANEYLNHFGKEVASKISFEFAVGSNYFFEISKLRAFRLLWSSLLKEYGIEDATAHILAKPTLRNKTLYDYNTNLLRTTSECMSAVLGGANTVANVAYDSVYHKSNEFGERIARNQLLILQQESYLQEAQSFANGAYYIESITQQLAEKALEIFKTIEKGGGFLKQLKAGSIQKKITESAAKEENKFQDNKIVLLGTNLQPNATDAMKNDLELYPFVKQRNVKTLITPIIRKRLSESIEKERLDNE